MPAYWVYSCSSLSNSRYSTYSSGQTETAPFVNAQIKPLRVPEDFQDIFFKSLWNDFGSKIKMIQDLVSGKTLLMLC